ncbi:MAG: Crp/Fnr family transcriptional regulator [Acutalibacteraceae bacterium]|nr:Crp/Fnr family transcriptional regulator [Acutalibacteraceae bacterium]HIR02885.1 Crp/Fnr family transcriptional regulator [Candidatus Scatovicinus merdipullorum]
MKKFFPILEKSPLFAGVDKSQIEVMLGCMDGKTVQYEKNAYIFRAGTCTETAGLLLDGSACIFQEDFWGNRNIIAKIAPGQIFAEAFACTQGAVLNVSVVADAPAVVLFLQMKNMIEACAGGNVFYSCVIYNLLSTLAQRNLYLNEKLTHMAQRTTREKLLSYLSAESARQNAAAFAIPYNRQQLADYLSVDRSAMSNALCKLRDQGVLQFKGKHFVLCEKFEETRQMQL